MVEFEPANPRRRERLHGRSIHRRENITQRGHRETDCRGMIGIKV